MNKETLVSIQCHINLARDQAPFIVSDTAPLKTKDIFLRALGLRHLVLHLGRVLLTRTEYVLEVLSLSLPTVIKCAVPVLVNHARNRSTIRVSDGTPERLVSNHALRLIVRLVGEVLTSANYKIQSGK